MKFSLFLRDKIYSVCLFFLTHFSIMLLLFAFKIDFTLIVVLSIILIVFYILILLIDYFRKKSFYDHLLLNVERLDKSYLVLETLSTPKFYEGQLLWNALYDINKSMNENVKHLELQINDFKEYIEMWIHEVKMPISSLILIAHNDKKMCDKRLLEQIRRMENYVDQVLYYVRQDNAEKDYLINNVSLDKIISQVALKNKDDLLENKVDLIVTDVNVTVLTDSKWLEFILNQIINNSIKYKKDKCSYIKIKATDEDSKIVLMIEDNGIGIPSQDILRIFEKSFTGYNGRIKTKSTGMGLFIARNLCRKLGHDISVVSEQNKYTRIYITFFKNRYYDVLK